MYESFLKRDKRIKLVDTIVDFMNELFPDTKCYKEKYNKGYRIMIYKNGELKELMIIGQRKRVYIDEFGDTEVIIMVDIFIAHPIWKFLVDKVFENYIVDSGGVIKQIEIHDMDINSIISKITKENYEKFSIEQDINKYNL